MLAHLRIIAIEAKKIAESNQQGGLPKMFSILSSELEKLDAQDFAADARADFLKAKHAARDWATKSGWNHSDAPIKAAELIANVVTHYKGKGSGGKSRRNFTAITNPKLKAIIERDYDELECTLMPEGAWKSVVIMAGSILEALLYDKLTADPTVKSKAMASPLAPKDKSRTVIDPEIDEWKLIKLIDVAADIGVLNEKRARTIDQVLRDYRNFVHPKVEIKAAHSCSESEATLAWGTLNVVLDDLGF